MRIESRPRVVATWIILLLAAVTAHAQKFDSGKTAGNIEVLSDTKGVDIGPYLSQVLKRARANWYNLIPAEARPPQLMPGVTSIEFTIMPSGDIAGIRIVHPSGSSPLDRAAWGAITQSKPCPPLPQQFTGPYLALRFHFYYNPQKLPLDQRPVVTPAPPETQKPDPNGAAGTLGS